MDGSVCLSVYQSCLFVIWILYMMSDMTTLVHFGSLLVLPIASPLYKCLFGNLLCNIINLWLYNIFYNIFS